jgi:hypothetical protein
VQLSNIKRTLETRSGCRIIGSGFLSELGHKRLAHNLKRDYSGVRSAPLAIFDESQTAKQPPTVPFVAR